MYLYNAQMEIKDVLAMPSTIKRSLQAKEKKFKRKKMQNYIVYIIE